MFKERIISVRSSHETIFLHNGTEEPVDRSKYLTASTFSSCARSTYFDKHDAPVDTHYTPNLGYFWRGSDMEDGAVEALRESLNNGECLMMAGEDQRTLVFGRVAATPDGVFVSSDGEHIVIEIKSLDPRSNIYVPKQKHIEQAQVQIELINLTTDFKPTRAVLLYIDASDYSLMVEHDVARNEEILEVALKRADLIFNSESAMDLIPEGSFDGSCRYCRFTQACGQAVLDSLPPSTGQQDALEDELMEELDILIRDRRVAMEQQVEAKTEQKKIEEQIKRQLRTSGRAKLMADHWTISYSRVRARKSLDQAALKSAGIDLDPFYKTSPDSDRLTIREKNQDYQ